MYGRAASQSSNGAKHRPRTIWRAPIASRRQAIHVCALRRSYGTEFMKEMSGVMPLATSTGRGARAPGDSLVEEDVRVIVHSSCITQIFSLSRKQPEVFRQSFPLALGVHIAAKQKMRGTHSRALPSMMVCSNGVHAVSELIAGLGSQCVESGSTRAAQLRENQCSLLGRNSAKNDASRLRYHPMARVAASLTEIDHGKTECTTRRPAFSVTSEDSRLAHRFCHPCRKRKLYGTALHRAWFGTRRAEVQILSPRQ